MADIQIAIQGSLFIASFIGVWLGAGWVIDEIISMAKSLKMSYFTLSFFLLGLLTSLPEMSVGITSIVEQEPQIFIGTLIGGVLIIFLLVIPLLAIIGNGVSLPHNLSKKQLLFALLVVVAPSLLISDRQINVWEGILLMALYASLFLFFAQKESLVEKIASSAHRQSKNSTRLLKIGGGLGLLVAASRQIIVSTEYFADLLNWSSFLVGLLAVSLGTNIPELSLIIRSVYAKKKNVALADYIGSAAANTLLFGVATSLYGSTITIPNHFMQRFIFLSIGLLLFFVFSRSRSVLSRWEGVTLIGIYGLFVVVEIVLASGH